MSIRGVDASWGPSEGLSLFTSTWSFLQHHHSSYVMGDHLPLVAPPEADLDSEILRLENHLQTIRKRRLLEELRLEVAYEEERLLHVQSSYEEARAAASRAISTPPRIVEHHRSPRVRGIKRERPESLHYEQPPITPGDPLPDTRPAKRSRSDSSGLTLVEPTHPQASGERLSNDADKAGADDHDRDQKSRTTCPPSPEPELYRAKSAHEFRHFIYALGTHFDAYGSFYASDSAKIKATIPCVTRSIAKQWNRRLRQGTVHPTWADFCALLYHQVGCKMSCKVAEKQYQDARQGSGQPVREFADHLQHLYTHLPSRMPDSDRNGDLWDRVRPHMRFEAYSILAVIDKVSFEEFTARLVAAESKWVLRCRAES